MLRMRVDKDDIGMCAMVFEDGIGGRQVLDTGRLWFSEKSFRKYLAISSEWAEAAQMMFFCIYYGVTCP